MADPPPLPTHLSPPPEDQPPPGRSWWRKIFLIVLFGLGGLAVIAYVAFIWAIEVGRIPDTVCIPGAELSEHAEDFLRDAGIIERDEKVLFYYSEGVFSFGEDGNLFTDQRIISYWEDEDTGERIVLAGTYDQVVDIEFRQSDGLLESSTIVVTLADETTFALLVSSEEGGDRDFHQLLVKTWKAKR